MNDSTPARAELLVRFGAEGSVISELLEYNSNRFDPSVLNSPPSLPLPDEPFVADWELFFSQMQSEGVFPVLRRVLVQLQFPVREGMSKTDSYSAVVTKGVPRPVGSPEPFPDLDYAFDADKIEVRMHSSPAGRIPVIIAGTRRNFVRLVQSITAANEPVVIPNSMGALMVGGYRNWTRLKKARESLGSGGFGSVAPPKESYLDRFIVLGPGPYSGVPAESMGFSTEEWDEKSLVIRMEHEAAHYFTRRLLGSMKNNLFDELLADYMGISAAAGCFRAEWFLRFMGLENPDALRPGGRMENYRGSPPLSDDAFSLLQNLLRVAAVNVERFDQWRVSAAYGRTDAFLGFASATLEELADEGAVEVMKGRLTRIQFQGKAD